MTFKTKGGKMAKTETYWNAQKIPNNKNSKKFYS